MQARLFLHETHFLHLRQEADNRQPRCFLRKCCHQVAGMSDHLGIELRIAVHPLIEADVSLPAAQLLTGFQIENCAALALRKKCKRVIYIFEKIEQSGHELVFVTIEHCQRHQSPQVFLPLSAQGFRIHVELP